ncbi:MAG: DHH family phosphoesterase [Treponemataceae bacterium]
MAHEKNLALVKKSLPTIASRNQVFAKIIKVLDEGDSFLLLGHANPDEDCIGALVAFALLARKMQKSVTVYQRKPFPYQFTYLSGICEFNSIHVLSSLPVPSEKYSAIVVLDTPKPSMIDIDDASRGILSDSSIRKIEIDHHLETDAEYFGDEEYRLVSNASSSCELIGFLAYKIDKNKELKNRYGIEDVFTRNLVLAVLTGIIGDSGMGRYFKTTRERRLYDWLSALFDNMLALKTRQGSGNYKTKEQIFESIASLSKGEGKCFERIYAMKLHTKRFDYIFIPEMEVKALCEEFGDESFISVVKSAADTLSEQNGTFGLIAYPDSEGLVQFRVRRSRDFTDFDLRDILSRLSLTNGGGHPGAIGFRIPKSEISDPASFTDDLVQKVSAMLDA